MRTSRTQALAVAATVVGAVGSAIFAPFGVAHADDDISNYDGSSCETNQFYDASIGDCNTDTVANDPGAPPMDLAGLAADLVSLSDPGAQCSSTQYFSVTNAVCLAQTIVNDPKAPVVLEGENPPPPPQMGPPSSPKPTTP